MVDGRAACRYNKNRKWDFTERNDANMQTPHRWASRLAALFLAALLLMTTAWAEEETEAPITHIAKASVALKVRRRPESTSTGGDSIPRGEDVMIVEYGADWCKVRTSHLEGWVMTKYLLDIKTVDGEVAALPESEAPEGPREAVGELMPGFTTNESNFYEGYYAHTVVDGAAIYERPTENSRQRTTVKIYQRLVVSENSGDWSLVRYNNVCGYMRTDNLFKWDRIDPYIGEIPGLEIWPNLAFVNHTTVVRDMETDKPLQTVNPGAALSVGEMDEQGRYPVPYDRVTGYISQSDVAWVMPVTAWDEAQSGDLISVMTTFFAVGKTTLQYQGRNWNIHLASGFISGTVLQPGQTYNMNETIGPYKQSTGYKSAPILSPHALSGYGGGTCQVNTTFYISTIQVPLLVTHRKVHAEVGMHYAEKGFDAAVGSGNINLTMQNTLPYAIRYQFWNSDGVLTCCIFRD